MFKAMAKRAQILMALCVGAAFGSAATGCGFLYLGIAHADSGGGTVMSAPCTTTGTAAGSAATFAVLQLAGRTKEDLAVNAYLVPPSASPNTSIDLAGGPYFQSTSLVDGPPPLVADGAIAVQCVSGQTSAQFFVR